MEHTRNVERRRASAQTIIFFTVLSMQACGENLDGSNDGSNHPSRHATPLHLQATDDHRVVTLEEIELARVDLPNGQFVGWYEPIPGFLVMGQSIAYPVSSPVLLDSSLSPTQQYRQLAPEGKIPDALLEAEARAAHYAAEAERSGIEEKPSIEIVSVAGVRDGTSDSEKALPDDSACPWSWFSSNYCPTAGWDWTVSWSYRTGTSYFQRDDNNRAGTAMCSYRGAVHYRVKWRTWWDWTTSVDVVRQTGEGWEWWRANASLDFDIESRVDEADGDGYHHCGSGY